MTEQPKRIPPYSIRDEVDLLWFFGIGQTAFERSTFGGMLDRAAAMAVEFQWPREPVLSVCGAVIGWESAITAWPTAELRPHGGYEPDIETAQRYARISKVMMRMERVDALASTVIACLFGDTGQRWADKDIGHGRNGALYHLTAKGKAIVAAAANRPGALELTAQQRIENECIGNKTKPKPELTAALAVCARQAEDLERRARAVWHSVQTT